MTNNKDFALKTIGAHRLLYVMAASAEYGPNLQARLAPLITGVGPVEAGISLGACLAQLTAQNQAPNYIVALGSAGSNQLNQTEIYQASSLSYRDMDASVLGFEKGITPFLDLPAVLPMPFEVPGVLRASLSTGANVISDHAYNKIDADMVDMESFALKRAADIFNIPLIVLRGISDGQDALNKLTDWTKYLHIIDEKLAQTVDVLEHAIANDLLITQ